MKLIETDGKRLLARHGIPVPAAALLAPGEEPSPNAGRAAVKAQVLAGGRGKAGLVRMAEPGRIVDAVAGVRAALGPRAGTTALLIEDAVICESEWYLACRVDDIAQCPVLLFSTRGGIEVEANAASVHSLPLDPLAPVHPHHLVGFFRDAGVRGPALGPLTRIGAQLARAFVAEDAALIEINPLGRLADGKLVALDAKVVIDDNAVARHPELAGLASARLADAERTGLEREADAAGITFVELGGEIALITGGAGLGMAVADMLSDAGLPPANFVDATGGGDPRRFAALARVVFERARRPDVRAIVVYLVLGASPLKGAVDGLLSILGKMPPPKPIVIGLTASGAAVQAMSVDEAKAAFAAHGLTCVGDLDELIPALRAVLSRSGINQAAPSASSPAPAS